jgi:hypothetical protein
VLVLVVVIAAVIGTLNQDQPTVQFEGPAGEESAEPVDALTATVTHFGDDDDCPNFIFDADAATGADEFLASVPERYSSIDLTGPVMAAGGYVVWGTEMYINLQSDMTQQVTVFGIRAEILEVKDTILGGTYIDPPDCGGEPLNKMALFLNAPDQGPFMLDEGSGEPIDRGFFDEQVINVAPGAKQSLEIDATNTHEFESRTYEFELVIDYELDGELSSLVLDNSGEPFRVAAVDDCQQDRYFGETSWYDWTLDGETEQGFRPLTAEEVDDHICDP